MDFIKDAKHWNRTVIQRRPGANMNSSKSDQRAPGKVRWPAITVGILLVVGALITLSSGVYYAILLSNADGIEGTATVRGTYFNSRDRRVEGVLVRVEGTDISDVTDDRGKYELKDVPGGARTIIFERGGYRTIRVKQLVVPSDKLTGSGGRDNILNIPDNIAGGRLVEKPRYHYDLIETELEAANLTGQLMQGDAPVAGALVTVHNSTLNATSNGEGFFNVSGLAPGAVMLNVSQGPIKTFGAAMLSVGNNTAGFELVDDNNTMTTLHVNGAPIERDGPYSRNVTFNILNHDRTDSNDVRIFAEPVVYNEINMTLLRDMPPFYDWVSGEGMNGGDADGLRLIPGNIYKAEVAVHGRESLILWNVTRNGTDEINVTLGESLDTIEYEYSLTGFVVVMLFMFLFTLLIIYGIHSAFRGNNYSRVMTGGIAALVSSASLPLAALSLPLAHNWMIGACVVVVLLLKRKSFSGTDAVKKEASDGSG